MTHVAAKLFIRTILSTSVARPRLHSNQEITARLFSELWTETLLRNLESPPTHQQLDLKRQVISRIHGGFKVTKHGAEHIGQFQTSLWDSTVINNFRAALMGCFMQRPEKSSINSGKLQALECYFKLVLMYSLWWIGGMSGAMFGSPSEHQ